MSGHDHLHASVVERGDCAGRKIELSLEVVAFDGLEALGLLCGYLTALCRTCDAVDSCSSLNRQLFIHLYVACFRPGGIVGESEFHVHVVFAAGFESRIVVGYCVGELLTRSERHARSDEGVALLHLDTILVEAPADCVVGERGEIVLVEDLDLTLCHVDRCHTDVLVNFLNLEILRLRGHVAEHHAVHHKLTVAGVITEVATESEVAVAGLRIMIVERLVDPVPDSSTHEMVGAFHRIPVIDETADGVAHRVGILGDVERIFEVELALDGFLYPCYRGVLVGAHVDYVVVALILHWA